nr:hypothetical protein [Pleurocapsa sp. MO_226.B13]
GKFNLLAYHQRDYRQHKVKESWFIITNLDDPNEVIKLYKKRAGWLPDTSTSNPLIVRIIVF